MYTPWTKLNVDEIRFLEKVLAVNPKERLTIEQICEEQWFKTEIPMPEVSDAFDVKKYNPRESVLQNVMHNIFPRINPTSICSAYDTAANCVDKT